MCEQAIDVVFEVQWFQKEIYPLWPAWVYDLTSISNEEKFNLQVAFDDTL